MRPIFAIYAVTIEDYYATAIEFWASRELADAALTRHVTAQPGVMAEYDRQRAIATEYANRLRAEMVRVTATLPPLDFESNPLTQKGVPGRKNVMRSLQEARQKEIDALLEPWTASNPAPELRFLRPFSWEGAYVKELELFESIEEVSDSKIG